MATPVSCEMTPAPVSDAAFIFNFFLRPVMPDLQSGVQWWAEAGDRIAKHHKGDGKYLSTHLHMAISEESHFQVFNFAAFTDFSALPFLIATDIGAFMKIIGDKKDQDKRPPTRAIPGGFKEIKGLTRKPDEPSLPKWRPLGSVFVVATYAFEVDIPRGPPPPGSPPGPPGLRPASSDVITAAKAELEADWINATGAGLLARRDAVSSVYLYKRETHGVAAYVLRAECSDAAAAKDAAAELKACLDGSEFLSQRGMRADVDCYEIVVNGDGDKLEENRFGVV